MPTEKKTVLRTVELENRMQFRLDPAVLADTPDLFGAPLAAPLPFRYTGSDAADFHERGHLRRPGRRRAQRDGVFVDPDQVNSARAVTIMGATALIHRWRWNGRAWVE